MLELIKEIIVVILAIDIICKGCQRHMLRPYSKGGNIFSDENTRIAMRENASNPLFVKGHFRKNYKRNIYRKMSNLKGFYFCQIVSIIQISVICLNLLNGFYIRYIDMNGIFGMNEDARLRIYIAITVWICINSCVNLVFLTYYTRVINNTRSEKLKKICRKKIIIPGEKQEDGYEILVYPRELSYREWIYRVEKSFRNQFRGSSWEYRESVGELKENVHMLIEEDREQEKIRIFVQMYVDILSNTYIEQLNKFLYKKIRSGLRKGDLPLGNPYLMYVICVQKKSETFENIFCKSIKAGQEDCFLIGVVLDEYMIYMPKMKNNVQDMQYQEMKTEFMEILKFIPLDDC